MKLRRIVFVILFFLCWYYSLTAKEKVMLSVTPKVCLPLCTIRSTTVIERHADNRWLVLSWSDVADASGFAGQSHISLDGQDSPIEFVRDLKDVPKGAYLVASQLFRNGKQVGYADQMVYVGVSPGER